MISQDPANDSPVDSMPDAPFLNTFNSSSSSSSVDMPAEPASPAAATDAAAPEAASDAASDSPTRLSQLPAFDTASEVQEMAAQVLQRKQQRPQHGAASAAMLGLQDPLYLLTQPEKNLRARKQQLMSAVGSNSSKDSARVAAAKEELAGVQARLRDALGLSRECSEEFGGDHYHPPLLKRSSHADPFSPTSSHDANSTSSKANKVHSSSTAMADKAATNALGGAKAAALSYKKQPAAGASAAAAGTASPGAAPSGAAARARAAGGPARAPAAATAAAAAAESLIYFDTSSEVAEMAARVLKRHTASAGPSV